MQLKELYSIKLEPVEGGFNLKNNKVLALSTPKKHKKARKEFIDYCNNLGFVPVNLHMKFVSEKKVTEVMAISIYLGVKNAKHVKTIESSAPKVKEMSALAN